MEERTMSECGIRKARQSKRGSALVSAMVIMIGMTGLLFVSLTFSTTEIRESRTTMDEIRTKYVADAGFEAGMLFLNNAIGINSSYDPMNGLETLMPLDGSSLTPIVGTPLLSGTAQVGAYTVSMTRLGTTSTSMLVQLDVTGYLPDTPANTPAGQPAPEWSSMSVTVSFELEPSSVFDYAYFINNWGWFYGNTIYSNGNARSNGQFDVAGYSPTITGQPIYEGAELSGSNVLLNGYTDDNEDGLEDGNDGGVFAGWDIVQAQNLQGNGGNAENQHDFEDAVEMPNLSDLTQYKDQAISEGGKIQIAGVSAVDGVFGDDAGETGNLYLYGTSSDPIMLDGPVVATGDVIIHGYVSGQGSIYAGGNIYMPDSVHYMDPPSSERPSSNLQGDTEAWMSSNKDKDFLGLFSAENVVVGDYTNNTWRYYVGHWMDSSLNQSSEDSGEDNIPNTINGKDGIYGTADDDLLEGDGVFSVETYTEAQASFGLIPPGYSVGDTIPGTGEDIDGDGVYDDTTSLSDVNIQAALNQTNWGGNMPVAGIANYGDIAVNNAYNLDATIYTNHSFCYFVVGNQPAQINGALVCRNENIVYGTPSVEMNHDARLLGGSSGLLNNLLPKTMKAPRIVRWQGLEGDPHRYVEVVSP
jgi:hypothetical protein